MKAILYNIFILILSISGLIYILIATNINNRITSTDESDWSARNMPLNDLVNISNINYIINGSSICYNMDVQLVVVVFSAPKNEKRRHNLRSTWITEFSRYNQVAVAFLTGQSPNIEVRDNLLKEAKRTEDLVIVDFIETYKNLSLKSVLLLEWIRHFCPHATFAMKVDDDMFINTENVINYVQSLDPNDPRFYGMLSHRARPIRRTKNKNYFKWIVSRKEYSRNVYPDYVTGGSYLFSTKNIDELIDSCLNTNYFFLEDIFLTGFCAKRANYSHTFSDKFINYNIDYKNCTVFNIISAHEFKGAKFYDMWKYYANIDIYHTCKNNTTN